MSSQIGEASQETPTDAEKGAGKTSSGIPLMPSQARQIIMELLDQKSPWKRQDLAAQTDIPEKLILEWINLSDLIRIKGIGEEYSDLLEEAGVDTIKELRNRNPYHLYETVKTINAEKHLVRRLPSQQDIEKWVKEAKNIQPIVTY